MLLAKSSSELSVIVTELDANPGYSWRALGDRDNNVPTTNISVSPPRSLVERITNAADALLEDKAYGSAEVNFLRSPKDAAQTWFGVPDAGLHALSIKERQRLADSVRVSMYDGDSDQRPTVDVRDFGIGIPPELFPETILSLNRSNKLNKFYLCGAFGQGGASTFAASQYTVIISRARVDPARISGTVVRYNPLDPYEYKHGRYEYLVTETKEVPAADYEPGFEFEVGTLVRHIGYEMEGCTAPLGPGQNSIYGLTQSVLFDPILPFWVEDFRKERSIRRTVIGSRNRLLGRQHEDEGERWPGVRHYQEPSRYRLGRFGDLLIEYWVVEPAKGVRETRRPNEAYVDSRNPIVLTLNGQVQGDLPASLVKKEAKLPMVAARLVVHIRCDQLSPEGRRLLFPSTREQARRGEVLGEVSQALVQLLANDDVLKEVEEELRESGIEEVDLEAKHEIRKRVAEFLAVAEGEPASDEGHKEDKEGTVVVGRKKGGTRRPLPPLPTQEPPTWIDILGEPPIKLKLGRTTIVRVHADAPDDYFDENDTASRIHLYAQAPAEVLGSTPLRGGRIRYWVSIPPEAGIGTLLTLTAEIHLKEAPALRAEKQCILVEPPRGTEDETKLRLPPFEYHWIGPEDANWATVGFTRLEEASQVQESGDKVHIYLSTVFDSFKAKYDVLGDRDPTIAKAFKSRYEIYSSAYGLLQLIRGRDLRKGLSGELLERLEEFEAQERTRVGFFVATVAWRETRGIRDLLQDE